MKGFDLLHQRVCRLLDSYESLLLERNHLQKELAKNEQRQAELVEALRLKEEELLAARIGKAITGPAERAENRKKLDAVITQIDKILITLND